MKSREYWLDAAKGIGILLVAIGHNGVLCHFFPLHAPIFSFHMPLFFILSGATISASHSLKNILIRSASLYWVFLIVGILTLPFALHRSDSAGLPSALQGLIFGCGYTIHMTPLWYLVCLALATPIAWAAIVTIQRFSFKTLPLALTALMFIYLGWLFLRHNQPTDMTRVLNWGDGRQGMILNVDLLPTAVGFLIAGRVITDNIRNILSLNWVVIFIIFMVFLWTSINEAPGLDLNLRSTPSSFPHYITAACLGSIITIWVCQHLKFKLIAKIGASTLPILAIHPALTNKISFLDKNSLLLAALGTIVGVGIPYLADQFFIKKSWGGQFVFYPRKFFNI